MKRGKSVQLPCTLLMMNGKMFRGYTKAISPDTVNLVSGDLASARDKTPQPGDQGMITMSYTREGVPHDVRAGCRVIQVMGNAANVAMNANDLTSADRKALKKIMEVLSSEIGKESAAD